MRCLFRPPNFLKDLFCVITRMRNEGFFATTASCVQPCRLSTGGEACNDAVSLEDDGEASNDTVAIEDADGDVSLADLFESTGLEKTLTGSAGE